METQSAIDANRQWEDTFNAIESIIVIVDDRHRIVRANAEAKKRLAHGENIIGKHCHTVFHNTETPIKECAFCNVLATGKPSHVEIKEKALGDRWHDFYAYPVKDGGNVVRQVVHVITDIHERKSQTEETKEKEEKASDLFECIIETTNDGIMIENDKGAVVFANQALIKLLRYEQEKDVLHRPWIDFFSLDDEKVIDDKNGCFESMLNTSDGKKIPILISSTRIYFKNEYIGVLSVIKDITEHKKNEQELARYRDYLEDLVRERTAKLEKTTEFLKKEIEERRLAEERVKYLALHDNLTGLPNRLLFFERLDHEIKRTHRSPHKLSIFFLDLDGFKSVNDQFGHEAGDYVLKETAGRIQKCLRDTDMIARLGGDEFSIILPDQRDEKTSENVAQRIIKSIAYPYHRNGREIKIGVSIGISVYPKHGRDPHSLVKNADSAMYKIKNSGKNNYVFFSPGSDPSF
jgi:diguanylate cyclase (GGDEF)-like protein/PAS domain S-box-containing protein